MNDLLILILACILSSVITIFFVLFAKNIKALNHKKQVSSLFNLVKKNRLNHAKKLKELFIKNDENLDNIEQKIIKFLNLEQAFFIEITKALLGNNKYSLNLLYKSYSELYTYLQLLFEENFYAHNQAKSKQQLSEISNKVHLQETNNLLRGNFKFNIPSGKELISNKSSNSLNDLYQKFYLEKDKNIQVRFNDKIDNGLFGNLDDNDSDYYYKKLGLELNKKIIHSNKQNNVAINNRYKIDSLSSKDERVLIVKNLTDETEEV